MWCKGGIHLSFVKFKLSYPSHCSFLVAKDHAIHLTNLASTPPVSIIMVNVTALSFLDEDINICNMLSITSNLLLLFIWSISSTCFHFLPSSFYQIIRVLLRNVKKSPRSPLLPKWLSVKSLCLWEANPNFLGNQLGTIPNCLVRSWMI